MATFRTSAAGGASSGSSNRTATLVPAVGDLWIVYAYVAANTNDTPTCSDNNGGTYTLIDVANCVTAAINYRLSVFVRDQLHTNTTSTVVTVATGSNTSGVVHILAYTGITWTGASAVRSKGLQSNQAAGTAAPALNQAALTGNPTIVAQGSADTTTTPPTNWTEAQDTSQINDAVALETAYRDSGFTGTTITFGAASSTTFCSHALELDSSQATAPLTQPASDNLNAWADALTISLLPPIVVSDNLNAWADALAKTLGTGELTLSVSDSVNNWLDEFRGSKRSRWLDAEAHNLAVGETPLTLSLSDSFTLTDNLALGYGLLLTDDAANWNDSLQLGYGLLLTDNAANWNDALQLGYGLLLADSDTTWGDAFNKFLTTNALELTLSDNMNLLTDGTPSVGVDYELVVTDDLNNWADAVTKTLGGGSGITLNLADNLNNWNDSLSGLLAHFLTVSDTITLSDSITVSLLGGPNLTLQVADSFTLTDALRSSLATSGAAVWQNLASVTLNAANLASVTFILQQTGTGDVVFQDTDSVTFITNDTDTAGIIYEDVDTAGIIYQDTDTA